MRPIRHFRIKHIALLSCMLLPLFLLEQDLRGEESAPSAHQCVDLYRHQLDVASKDRENPLAAAIGQNRSGLQDSATTELQVNLCLTSYSPELVQCQMAADSMRGLLDCMEKYPPGKGKQPGAVGGEGETPSETPGEPPRSPAPGTDQNGTKGGEANALPGAVDADSCSRAYNHLLDVYSHYPTLQKSADRQRLLDYWRSSEARNSFQMRCTSRFKLSDLSCILSTNDPDRIQGCLIQIPEE